MEVFASCVVVVASQTGYAVVSWGRPPRNSGTVLVFDCRLPIETILLIPTYTLFNHLICIGIGNCSEAICVDFFRNMFNYAGFVKIATI